MPSSSEERTELMDQLIANCTFPNPSKIKDRTCLICHEDSLSPNGGEPPIKLACGHILGLSCLSTWVFRQVEQRRYRSPTCPFCSAPLFSREESDRMARSNPNGIRSLSGFLLGVLLGLASMYAGLRWDSAVLSSFLALVGRFVLDVLVLVQW